MKKQVLRLICVFCALLVQARAIDREAFTFTTYNLDVRIEPEQRRLAVRGNIRLRMIRPWLRRMLHSKFHPAWIGDRSKSTAARFSLFPNPILPTSITPAHSRRRW